MQYIIGCITDDAIPAFVAEQVCGERVDVVQALDTLVGLRAESAEQGGYKYTHRSTGYTFEIRPSEGDSTPEHEVLMPGQRELLFIPLDLGMAAQVKAFLRSVILASKAFQVCMECSGSDVPGGYPAHRPRQRTS